MELKFDFTSCTSSARIYPHCYLFAIDEPGDVWQWVATNRGAIEDQNLALQKPLGPIHIHPVLIRHPYDRGPRHRASADSQNSCSSVGAKSR